MKILHTADIHLGDLNGPVRDGKNARRQDTLDCMTAVVNTAREERPNVTIIAGDLFNRSRVWADTALEDITDAIDALLRPLCRASEQVVLLFGTENHDNPRAFEVIAQTTKDEANLHILTQPDVYTFGTSDGEIQILALPGYDKGRLRTFMPDADKEAENRNATTLINDVLLGLGAKLDKTKPSILVAHYTVAGSEADNGSTFLAGQDVVLLPQTIDATGVTLATLGHIHKPQKLNCVTPAYYSGSINQLTFNDEPDKHGFYLHEISEGREVRTKRYLTPERRHFTLRFREDDIAAFLQTGNIELPPRRPRGWYGAIVRVRYKATAEQDKALNKAELQRQLLAAGAFHVAEILADDVDSDASAYEDAGDGSPAEALRRYLDTIGTSPNDHARLEELAAPLIRKADDGRESNLHVGAFLPKRVVVKNYRSYTAAAFDFTDIRMAMVNGPNGVGKSSLFMDAIADCLFEASRDEAVGGWMREGEKSGAVAFEFEIGGIDYRVTRTRTKSGKGTLAFNRMNDGGEWEDCGDTTTKLTQAKIEQTLGMDCQTFCSVALIRQDAYGIFLEADSDRMEVLSALLSLGVYVRLEELAKAEVSSQRRTLASLKDRMSVLARQIETKAAAEAELKEVERLTGEASRRIDELDSMITTAQREEALRQEAMRQANEKEQEAQALEIQIGDKENALRKLAEERDEAQRYAGMVDESETATVTVAAARRSLEQLAPDEAELQILKGQHSTLLAAIGNINNRFTAIANARKSHQAILARKDEIQAAVAVLETVRVSRADIDRRVAAYSEARQAFTDAEARRKTFLAESRRRIGELETRLAAEQKKTALLKNSQCPIVDTATCAFLKDAQAAKAEIAKLNAALDNVKADDKAAYEKLQADEMDAQTARAAMTDPKTEAEALTRKEREAAPIAALAPKLAAAAASIEELDKQAVEQTATLKNNEAAVAEIAHKLPDLEAKAASAAEHRAKIRDNEPTANLLAKCTAAAATVASLVARISEAESDIENARRTAQTARLAAKGIRESIPAGESNIGALTQDKRAKEEYKTSLAQQAGGLKGKLESIAGAETQHEQYRSETQGAARMLSDYTTLAQCFGIDGIQCMIIRSIIPEIMHRANEILAAMTGGKMVVDFRTEREQKSNAKIVNCLDVWIASLSGGSRPYCSHSGGEKVKAALAVTLALADVKARRAGAQLGMLFIDEPPFLDADGTEAYADALASIAARNPGMRILAISHDPAMKARFAQNIIVKEGDNGSEVVRD